MMWNNDMSWLGWASMIAWWAFVIAGIVWLVRTVAGNREQPASARRLLDERFAAGDLTVEEYQERRRVLQ